MPPWHGLSVRTNDARQAANAEEVWRQAIFARVCRCETFSGTWDEATRPFGTAKIFTVAEYLRLVRPGAYSPFILVMGPYHTDRESPEIAELKIFSACRSSPQFLKLNEYVRQNIAKFTEMYDRKLEVEAASLSLMLALDASFLSDILSEYVTRNYPFQEATDLYDNYVLPRRHFWAVLRDLMLMENQIPMEVLNEATVGRGRNLEDDVYKLITYIYPFRKRKSPDSFPFKRPNVAECHHLLEYLYCSCTHKGETDEKAVRSDVQIRAATQLRAAGIQFEAVRGDLGSINFDSSTSTLNLPILEMYSETETWFRNLMAYEQCRNELSVHWCSYMRLMGCLIDTAEDVKLLTKRNVLVNLMGSNEAVAKMWNSFGVNVELFLTKRDKAVMECINTHCNSIWKVWSAEVRSLYYYYFSRPWSVISAVAAFFLLALALLQTIFTIASYFSRH